ncbi:PREDICTED: interferon-induced very large GTPase 1-like [Myotis brandtii]|uniref:interferon-induced very large GTPase 1-like n=1 Tax=Myotis brandtii TaxID=109478 RepID=UPI000703E855|nr:PREDICTED: interferon-induced very large GTPase 1-like [Myotis brandtii]
MDTAESTSDEPLVRGKSGQDLEKMLREVGLAVEYWLPKLQEHLGVTCAQALQYIEEKDLQKLKSQAQHPWEKRALEKLLNSNSLSKLQESQVKVIKEEQKKAEQALQELRDLLSEGRQRQEEEVRKKEAELRQAMEIPKEYWPPPEKSLREVMEQMQGQLNLMEATLSHRQNLPDRDLVRWASGGLALQGIYKNGYQKELIQKRQELLSVPKEFLISGPEHGTRMETREFTSSQEESKFTQMTEKLGFSVIASAKGGGWGFSLEAGMELSKHSESKENQQSRSEHSYFCSTKFSYVPLASCHFPMDQLQFSKAALQELKCIEDILGQPADTDRVPLLRQRTEAFFHKFGSHANQGPLHLGGIYWWKAVSEGFRSEQLAEVKKQAAKALDVYITGSYSGFGLIGPAGADGSYSSSETNTQSTTSHNLQTKVQLSVAQTGGPPEANGFLQWKAGLVASNQTWSVIDRGLQLVPVWDIILYNHRSDFKDPCQVASLLKDSYSALTCITAQIQDGEELLSVGKEAGLSLEDVKSWKVSDPEEQLKKLITFMQILSKKTNSYNAWVNICLTDWGLQNFLVNTVNFYKNSSIYETKFIKSQLRSLLYPHIYRVNNFPQAHSIMQWAFQSESEEEHINISQFSELIKILKKTHNDLMEVKNLPKSAETVEEAQRKATYEVGLSLGCFLNYLQETEQADTQLLLLSIAAGIGYDVVNKQFQYLLGCEELHFLVHEMQTAQDKYQELKNNCTYRAQAFLVLTGLTATIGVTALSPEEKTQRLALIRHLLGQSLSKEVVHVLSKPGADHDWENLEKDLRLLIDGNYEATINSLQMDEISKNLQSIFHERKEPHETHDNDNIKREVIKDTAFLDLLQHLGLDHFYPKKMSRTNFHVINKTSVYNSQPRSERELPLYFLQKLQVLDYGLRYLVFRDDGNTQNQFYPSASNQENEAFDPYEDLFEDRDTPINPSSSNPRPHINPMDIQMAILHCADDFARQYILSKLSICQFALPLLIPNPCSSQIDFSLWSLRQIRRSWQEARKSPRVEKINYKNKLMCHVSTPIVSFIRVGNGFSASKSQIMNCLLSKRKHDVFFHRHCRGSTKDCLLMGGVVEICWFCPGGDDEDRFDNCVTFTNLHGDSTLLNALFGLQFTVSAGRCTRGAYMQLLKVEETFTDELGFDFVLVVDTEGLRALQLSNKSKNRDNELATFVIGLGNLTLINIFGENPSEMQDILQIVVQAFMRMKQVKISPSCLFVHQNVGEVTAKDQTMEERRALEQRLDDMAAIAAEQEQCSDVTRFGDIIKFDVNTDVFYFAHLWDGNPPMAPPNPCYSHNVQDLKRRILMVAKQESRGSIMKISDVKLRVQDLWRALVNENFIFSFRNTREVIAMSKLETMYNSWTWELRNHMLDLQYQLINQIKNGKIQELTANTLRAPVTEKYKAIKQELEKYFKEDPESEVIIQWKASFEIELENLKEALIFECKNKAEELISYKKNQEILDNKKSSYEKKLLEKSLELALTLKEKELSENELHGKFNELWETWVYDVSSNISPVLEPNIDLDSENILLNYFKKETDMANILEKKSRKKFEINYEKHVKMSKYFKIITRYLEVHDKESIKRTTDHIFSRYTETIKNLQKQQCDYNPNYFHEILNIIEEEVKPVSTEDRYTFTTKYKIDLSLCLFQRASEIFKEMHRAFKRANDPVNYLKSKKDDFLMSFKISCQGATSIKTFVEFLLEKLIPAVFDTIQGKMAPKIAGDMRATCPAFSGNRANLEKHVLISLAEKENFDDYWEYIHNAKSFFRNYIQNHIKRYCSEQNNKIKTFLEISIGDIKNAILSAIHESTAIAKDKSSTASGWLDLFCDHLGSNLNFPRKDLVSIEHQEINNIEVLKQVMSEALDDLMFRAEKICLNMPVEDMVPEIEKMLSEHLCGCWKQCPFCEAICTNTIPNHDGDHSVPFHRPKAVNGGQWVDTDHFNIDFCTNLVSSNYSFVLNGREIPFKTYRQAGGEYAKWSITPDTSTQTYWKWFVCHFRSNLEEKYQKKFLGRGEIPQAWTKITKQKVLDDLA